MVTYTKMLIKKNIKRYLIQYTYDRAEESSVYEVGWNPTCPKSNQQGSIELPMLNGNSGCEAEGKEKSGHKRKLKVTQLRNVYNRRGWPASYMGETVFLDTT